MDNSNNTLKIFYGNLSQTQKIGFWVLIQFLVIVVIVLLVQPLFHEKEHVEVENSGAITSQVPSDNMNSFKETLWGLISNNVSGVDKSVIDDVVIRDGTYKEDIEGDAKSVNFIIDIDSIKQTYVVSIGWSNNPAVYGPDDVSIECPPTSQMKYPETICYGMYNSTYSLDLYLPHAVYPEGHDPNDSTPLAPNYIIHGDEFDKTIDIEVSVCDAEKFKQEAMDYLNSTPIKLDEYKINYNVNDVDVGC